jgi:hypothetical protein
VIRLNSSYLGIELQCYKNGVMSAADALPTGKLYRDGVDTGQTVTVAATSDTGRYLASFTTLGAGAGWTVFDHLTLRIVAVIGQMPFPAVIFDSFGHPAAIVDANTVSVAVGAQQQFRDALTLSTAATPVAGSIDEKLEGIKANTVGGDCIIL